MPDVAQVEVIGLEKLLARLDDKKHAGALQATMFACGEILRGGVAQYPPETEANQPRAAGTVYSIATGRAVNRWYERGKGTVTSSGKVYCTSEDLGHSWTIRVRKLEVTVGSRVSYGRYVQGEAQAAFHKARGWKTIFTVVKEKAPEITNLLRVVLDRVL